MSFLFTAAVVKVAEEVSKNLGSLKEVLCGTGDKEPQTEAVAQLAQELYNTNLLIALIANLQKIDFEVRSRTFHAMQCKKCYRNHFVTPPL